MVEPEESLNEPGERNRSLLVTSKGESTDRNFGEKGTFMLEGGCLNSNSVDLLDRELRA